MKMKIQSPKRPITAPIPYPSEDNSRTKGEVTTDDEDPLETIRQAIAANGTVLEAPKQNAADSTDTESTAEAQPEKKKPEQSR